MKSTLRTIAIEILSEKLNSKLWVKGDLKRIYLDRGHNTKKMTTKTYIYENDNKFMVSCNIDCPSQNLNWIKSQQNEIIENVSEEINKAIFEFNNPNIDYDLEVEKNIQKVKNNKEQKEFLSELNSKKEGLARDYSRAITEVKIYDQKIINYNNASEEVKNEIAKLETEYKLINGTPGSKKRRIELENLLANLPALPQKMDHAFGENGWMRIASKFSCVENYIEFKEIEARKSLGL